MPEGRPFFIIGTGRSGTTAMCHILSSACNGWIEIEAPPKMCVAARQMHDHSLPDPAGYIRASVTQKVRRGEARGLIYGDKNPNYVQFITQLHSEFNCRFVFVVRDGRDVVSSAMNFALERTPTYRRYEDMPTGGLTEPEEDFWDFARLRPRGGEPWHESWRQFTLFEKHCWLWNRFNELLLEKSVELPPDSFLFFNISTANIADFHNIFFFLNLKGFDPETVETLTKQRINSCRPQKPFPPWPEWSTQQMEIFKRHAQKTMKHFNY